MDRHSIGGHSLFWPILHRYTKNYCTKTLADSVGLSWEALIDSSWNNPALCTADQVRTIKSKNVEVGMQEVERRILPVRVEFESQAKPEVSKLLEHCGEKTSGFFCGRTLSFGVL